MKEVISKLPENIFVQLNNLPARGIFGLQWGSYKYMLSFNYSKGLFNFVREGDSFAETYLYSTEKGLQTLIREIVESPEHHKLFCFESPKEFAQWFLN